MENKKNNPKTKTIILIVAILLVCIVVGFTVGKYLFELTHPDIDLLVNMNI